MRWTTARPSVSWSSVASFWAATSGNVVFGRSATIGLIRSVSWPTAEATTNESAVPEP
ncbi:hypothetical protein QE405_002217 [Nocardioides zeae]|uniref:Uncharacterized protein n=1 Tax=Nocardioides zeae TaxID=1457234 RepID=A0AAJ1X0U9_9ACTN|nr:hypothetical protein [Nocardioides zeae]